MTSAELQEFGWSIVELMGHRRLGGFAREQLVAGAVFLRVDVPDQQGDPTATQFYSASAIYCITPTTKETACALAQREQPRPVQRWELAPAKTDRDPSTIADDDLDEVESEF